MLAIVFKFSTVHHLAEAIREWGHNFAEGFMELPGTFLSQLTNPIGMVFEESGE
jgi:hypothetical protein